MTNALIPYTPSDQETGANLVTAQFTTMLEEFKPVVHAPAPYKSVEEQQKALRATPSAKAISKHPMGFYFLGIEAVRATMDKIFGPRNWGAISFPGYPYLEDIPHRTSGGKEFYWVFDRIYLLVIWQDAMKQRIEGMGQHQYYPSEALIGLSDAKEAARSDAIKKAARNLGTALGGTLRADIAVDGILEQAEQADNLQIILGAVGVKLWPLKGEGGNVIITQELLDTLAQQYGQAPVDKLDIKGARTLANLIAVCPTPAEYTQLVQDGIALGIAGADGMRFPDLKRHIAAAEREANAKVFQ